MANSFEWLDTDLNVIIMAAIKYARMDSRSSLAITRDFVTLPIYMQFRNQIANHIDELIDQLIESSTGDPAYQQGFQDGYIEGGHDGYIEATKYR